MFNLVHNTTSLKGYWGHRTSSINWCEPDYIHSYYVAELWNTFSNLFYIFCGVYAFMSLRSFYDKCDQQVLSLSSSSSSAAGGPTRSSTTTSTIKRLWRFYVCCAGVGAVGIGSFLFHCCLTEFTQALDEIAMNVGILCIAYCSLNMDDYKHQSREYDQIQKLPNGMWKDLKCRLYHVLDVVGFASSMSVYSIVSLIMVLVMLLAVYDIHDPATFQALFASCFLAVVALSFRRSHWHSHQFINDQNKAHNVQVVHQHMRTKKILLFYMVAMAAIGYSSWIVDNATCPRLELFKLHSIWHVLTSYACYLLGLFVTYSYYADMYDDWQFEMCKPVAERGSWINPEQSPPRMCIKYTLGFFPTPSYQQEHVKAN